jgi:hypothetical protein
MKRFSLLAILMGTLLVSSTPSLHAYPYCGGWGGYHGGGWGCYRGGWYGTGIPNGLGWTMFGLGAAAVAAPVAYAVAAPPVYYAPAPSVGYYNPPQTVVVEKPRRIMRETPSAPQSDLLAKVQSKLAALGYYKGNIDGSFGPQTELAVTKFQGENGLPMTGRVDLKTLSSLGISL